MLVCRISYTRGGLFQSNIAIILLDNGVTLAGAVFEFCPAQNLHCSARVLDDLLVLQNASCQAHSGPVGTEHGRKEIVGDSQRRGIHSILRDEQPAREALFDIVKPITGGCLRELHSLDYCVAGQNPLKLRS